MRLQEWLSSERFGAAGDGHLLSVYLCDRVGQQAEFLCIMLEE
jgi:hypothetical protein